MINCTLKEMASKLMSADNILLFPHVGIDGDCVGSCSAVAVFLRKTGKNVFALYNEGMPENLDFLDKDSIYTEDADIIPDEKLDIAMCIDNGSYDRFPDYEEKFRNAPFTICLDHHGTSIIKGEDGSESGIADMSHIDPTAAACGELTFELLAEMNKQWMASGKPSLLPDKFIGEAIYTAITTDTGNFQYGNTNRRCHEITAELYDWGVNFSRISVILYENERLEAVEIRGKAVSRMKTIAGGHGVISYLTYDELNGYGILPGETDPIINSLKSIKGVEFAAFLKEKIAGSVWVSLRAKEKGNVAKIAEKFDGGGHVRAAGCTIHAPVGEVLRMITAEIEAAVQEILSKKSKAEKHR